MFVVVNFYFMKQGASRTISVIFPLVILISGCAKISSPAGGPRDREIPVIVKYDPPNGSTDFTGKEIIVTFDEYIVLDKISEKFMVSPPMEKRPDIAIRGKSMRIRYEDELRDSTTYTFYFQDAIRDLNEGNAINNFQFVFSTGPFIDSLSVTGNVYTGLTLDPPENTMILLYSNLADSSVSKQLPDYITRSSANGEFRIDNVRPGIYRLFALQDADNSKNYNNRDELFAFLPQPVEITPEKNYMPPGRDSLVRARPVMTPKTEDSAGKIASVPPVIGEYSLVLSQAEKKLHYLTSSSRPSAYQLRYTLALPPGQMEFGLSVKDAPEGSFFIEKNVLRDTITVWLTDTTLYNRQQLETYVTYPFTDTLGITSQRTDTVNMRFLAPKSPRTRVTRRTAYDVKTNIPSQARPDLRITLTAPAPFLPPDTSRIYFFETEKEKKISRPFTIKADSLSSCRYFIDTRLEPGKNYLLISDSTAFRSIYGDYSDSAALKFAIRTPESYGQLTMDITGNEGRIIVQLLDNTENIRREASLTGNGKVDFPLLERGKYRLRAIFDLDSNGKWTTGDFELQRQPEPVSYYPAEIDVPENFFITQPWELKPENFKDPKLQKVKTSPGRTGI
jgi:hypothetical protein